MRIDAYTHFIPPKFFEKLVDSGFADIGKRMRSVPSIHDMDIRNRVVDSFENYAQILSYPMPPLEYLAAPDQVEDYARRKGWSIETAERWLAPILNYK